MKLFNIFLKLSLVILAICQLSCRKDFSTQLSSGSLSFSVDTLFLDTVFNNLSTNTHLLTVYNRSKNDIKIPEIRLAKNNSKYRLNVDGISGTKFNNIVILEKDSIFILVEGTINASDTDTKMLYEDKILFDPNGNKQDVELVTLVKDANFLFGSDTNFELSLSNITKEKPYVVFGNATVPKDGSLTIEAGSVIHFSENSSLTISEGATLNINGTLNDSIVFKGDNLSYDFDEIPGQWQGINIEKNAIVNIDFLKILNPRIGLSINESTTVTNILNTEIYNAANFGVLTQNANINANNLVIGQTGKSALNLQGGSYTFNHCTLANFWSKSVRFESNINLANHYFDKDDKSVKAPLSNANFNNCIVTGSTSVNNEISFDKSEEEAVFNFNFKNCLIDLEKGDDFLNTDNTAFYTNVLFNKETDFKDTSKNDLRIGLDNEGINKADPSIAATTPLDIIGKDRTGTPDIGAYQHIDFKTLETKE